MSNYFHSPFSGIPLKDQVSNPNIIVGEHSYYSGYYHGHSFDDCARYLAPDRKDVDKLRIGKYCSIGSGAVFMMAGNQGHQHGWISSFPFFYSAPGTFPLAKDGFQKAGDTIIGNDVWIGSEAMIMAGVTVGDGAVIASRALVTKNVAPYSIVAGNPARSVKTRFSEEQIAMLLEMKWWDWSEAQLADAMPIMCSEDIAGLYAYWQGYVV
ncbi:type B chloramphenicol O-acetyltransferase [Rhodobacteraceae bacterium RKSG542]|uniref:type B chloramphenicol O-acetyltransferase n=1 Tax=Pseudovibrio flavus TaxID=2529854 RepID=UPI0012BB8630|nr:type B chloramphenicol O-acetyltransferase [Pseudovibrio flavus]MTI16793.1 type B chloramphenicol O-acetyltransferase [Pseudovibrio flavus]